MGDRTSVLRWGTAALGGLVIAGTAVELVLIGHWKDTVQLLSWAALVLLAVVWALTVRSPRRSRVRLLLLAPVVPVAVWGCISHFLANREIAKELNPDAGFFRLLDKTLEGRLPLLAPLSLVVPAVLILLTQVAADRVERAP